MFQQFVTKHTVTRRHINGPAAITLGVASTITSIGAPELGESTTMYNGIPVTATPGDFLGVGNFIAVPPINGDHNLRAVISGSANLRINGSGLPIMYFLVIWRAALTTNGSFVTSDPDCEMVPLGEATYAGVDFVHSVLPPSTPDEPCFVGLVAFSTDWTATTDFAGCISIRDNRRSSNVLQPTK